VADSVKGAFVLEDKGVGGHAGIPFVGLANYRDILFNPDSPARSGLGDALRNTAVYAVAVTAGTLAVGSGTTLSGLGTISLTGTTTLSLASAVTFAAGAPQWSPRTRRGPCFSGRNRLG